MSHNKKHNCYKHNNAAKTRDNFKREKRDDKGHFVRNDFRKSVKKPEQTPEELAKEFADSHCCNITEEEAIVYATIAKAICIALETATVYANRISRIERFLINAKRAFRFMLKAVVYVGGSFVLGALLILAFFWLFP